MGKSVPRVDIPAKVTGGAIYVQDLRLADMVHARVVRPPSYGARLAVGRQRRGGEDARRAESCATAASSRSWPSANTRPSRPCARSQAPRSGTRRRDAPAARTTCTLPSSACRRRTTWTAAQPGGAAAAPHSARPTRVPTRCTPRSARRAPSALLQDGALTVWSHTQGVYPPRGASPRCSRMPPERVRCIHMEGSGCYGHNGADDAAADAALSPRPSPAAPCGCSGCAKTSTRGSRTARR